VADDSSGVVVSLHQLAFATRAGTSSTTCRRSRAIAMAAIDQYAFLLIFFSLQIKKPHVHTGIPTTKKIGLFLGQTVDTPYHGIPPKTPLKNCGLFLGQK
jgi:hypothetical protein